MQNSTVEQKQQQNWTPQPEVAPSALFELFDAQKFASKVTPYTDYESRLSTLKTLYRLVDDNSKEICAALNRDFSCRSEPESLISDITGSLSSIRYMIKNLRKLMRSRRRRTSIWYLPAKNTVTPVPIGVVGIMSPWNYPVQLMVAPAASALAAGNRVMAKMSEMAPNTADVMQTLVAGAFPTEQFTVVVGDAEVSAEFSSIPFDHLLFTGSTQVGRKIAVAAAKNLTPVTLELSGKSPVIITENCDVEEAARRTIWGKSLNSGQTCVAPDYALVPQNQLVDFIRGCRKAYSDFYPQGAEDETYTAIIDQRHFQRINMLLEDARANSEEVLSLAPLAKNHQKIPVTLVINPKPNAYIAQEEVFGPLLAVYTYKTLSDAIAIIHRFEDPLAMYIFTRYQQEAEYLRKQIRAAGVSVNDTLLHFLQNDLPFGGRGTSGYGRYHGKEGFDTFSHLQPLFHQRGIGRFTSLKLIYPPYGPISRITGRIIRLMP